MRQDIEWSIHPLSKLYHITDMEKSERQRRVKKNKHVVTVIVSITFDSESLSCLSKRKRQINIVIHNFRLNSPCFNCLHVLFWAIQSAVTVTNASQSIVGEISELTSGVGFFFPPPFVSSSKMDREWSNGAKHIKRRQSSTNTIKPWSRNYFPRRGSIAVQMFLQFSRQSPQTTKCP